MSSREVVEGLQRQGVDEIIAYQITTTPWGSSPTSVSVKAYDISSGARTDVSATVLSGAAGVVGDVITLPLLQLLTMGVVYRIEVKFSTGGNTFEAYFMVLAEY